ncbi:MAG: CPBP family intramembrane metalloprotease [Bdellovibrionales bacterium]|nr:CPBP family intramembrane metalloprotease [Bdellovibrionales bacterium]
MARTSRLSKPLTLALIVSLGFQVLSVRPAHAIGAGLAGTLSLVPGLGQIASGQTWEGLSWFAGIAGGMALLYTHDNVYRFRTPGDQEGTSFPIFPQAVFNLWMYNIYDAYRHAKPVSRKVSETWLLGHMAANINPLNLIDPIGAPIVAGGLGATVYYKFSPLKDWTRPVFFSFVGLGEEALFRGFLFPAFSDLFGGGTAADWTGAILSSAMFSAAHGVNGPEALKPGPLAFRFGFGMLFCWQVHRNKYNLNKNIFAHTWYDVLVTPIPGRESSIDGGSLQFKFHF